MHLSEYLERWGRAIFEGPFTPAERDVPPEVAEIRLAIFDEIRQKSYVSGGKKVFPYNQLRIRLRGVVDSRAALFTGRFFRQYFEQEVRQCLRRDDCLFPDDLRADVAVTSQLPKPDEDWLTVEAESIERPSVTRRLGKLIVVAGKANEPELTMTKARTNIGRTSEVYRSEGLFRRNDVCFCEDTEINRTVSREHAHVLFDRSAGEHRLFNDRWYDLEDRQDNQCGTWVVRDGMSHEVHRGGRGMKLQPGDEIHLGKAILRFQIK
jgi:hypothetical protein